MYILDSIENFRLGRAEALWRTGVVKRFPYLTTIGLLLALASAFGSVAVLSTSDGLPIANFINLHWNKSTFEVQPQVILSILSTITNVCIAFALSKAAVIAWWLKALRGGSIRDLHTSWACSRNLLPSPKNFTNRSWLGFAALLCGLVAIDGPLLQRASTVQVATLITDTNITLPISPDMFAYGGTGYDSSHVLETTMYTAPFTSVVTEFTNRSDMVIPNSGCTGQCNMIVEAAGFDIQCTQSDQDTKLNITDVNDPNQLFHKTIQVFNVTASDNSYEVNPPTLDHYLKLSISTSIKSQADLSSPMARHDCILTESVTNYNVTLTNDTVTHLEPWSAQKNSTKSLVPSSYTPENLQGLRASTVGGFTLAINQKFGASASLIFEGPLFRVLPDCKNQSTCSTSVMGPAVAYVNSIADDTATSRMTWADPMSDIISMVQELSFRFVLKSTLLNFTAATNSTDGGKAVNLDVRPTSHCYTPLGDEGFNITWPCPLGQLSQIVEARQTQNLPVYKTHWGYAAGAIALMLVSIISVLPVLHGFWRLGRHFSDSPIEIAKAFGAPILQTGNTNGNIHWILKDHGKTKVRYGVTSMVQDPHAVRETGHERHWSGVETAYMPGMPQETKHYSPVVSEDRGSPSPPPPPITRSSDYMRMQFGPYESTQSPMEDEKF